MRAPLAWLSVTSLAFLGGWESGASAESPDTGTTAPRLRSSLPTTGETTTIRSVSVPGTLSTAAPMTTALSIEPAECARPSAATRAQWRGTGRHRRVDGVRVAGLRPRRVTVYLPAGYDDHPTRRYPTLYAHDGQLAVGRGLRVDSAVDWLTEHRIIEPHIVVAIDRTRDRSRELRPIGERRPFPSLEAYNELLLDVVKPMVDATFRTRCGRDSTSIVGYSLGGLANFHLMLNNPDVFGAYACMSPSLWWGNGAALDALRHWDGPLPRRVWIDAGTREGRRNDDIPYFVRDVREARDAFLARGMAFGHDLGYLEDWDAPHAGWAGARRMRYALAFLLSDRRPDLAHPSAMTVHALRPVLSRFFPRSTVSVTTYYEDDVFRLTWPNDRVTLSTSNTGVVDVEQVGGLQATGLGQTLIEARLGSLVAVTRVAVQRPGRCTACSAAEAAQRR